MLYGYYYVRRRVQPGELNKVYEWEVGESVRGVGNTPDCFIINHQSYSDEEFRNRYELGQFIDRGRSKEEFIRMLEEARD